MTERKGKEVWQESCTLYLVTVEAKIRRYRRPFIHLFLALLLATAAERRLAELQFDWSRAERIENDEKPDGDEIVNRLVFVDGRVFPTVPIVVGASVPIVVLASVAGVFRPATEARTTIGTEAPTTIGTVGNTLPSTKTSRLTISSPSGFSSFSIRSARLQSNWSSASRRSAAVASRRARNR